MTAAPHTRLLALLAVGGLAIVVVLFALASGGNDQNVPEQPVETSVDEIVDVPAKYLREPVRVSGTALPIDDERFVLRGARELIVIRPEPGAVENEIRPGDDVTVAGVVENFDRLQVAELERLAETGRFPVLSAAPIELDDPFVSADRVES